NQCDVTNHQVNVQFLLQLQPEWQRFVTLVKQSQELKTVSYHKLYDILKQHQNEVNEIRAERLARTVNPLILVAQQQPAYHPQNHPNYYTQNPLTKSQQTTKNVGKEIVNSSAPIYDQEPTTVTEDDEMSNRANQDNLPRINRGTGYENQRVVNVVGARENVEQADWKDDTDDEYDDQELEAHYMYMAQIQEVTPDVVDNFGPIFDAEPLHKDKQDDTDEIDQERDLLASLIEKLKCEIDDSKKRNKFLESSNQALVDKLKGEIKDFKTQNKSLESSKNHFKEANNEPSKTNQLMFKDLKKFQAELDKYHDVNYASKVAIDCAKAKGDLICYNDNLALMIAPETDKMTRLDKESRSKLSDLIKPFEYDQLNNLYDLFVPQREKSPEQHYFSKASKMSHTSANNEISKESFNKQTTLLEKQMDESIPCDQKCKSSKELFKIKKSVDTIFDGVERCKQTLTKRTYFGHIDPFIQNTIKGNFCPQIRRINADLEKFHLCLNEEMVADLRYFNSLEHEVDTLKSQLETQKTQFLNEIDRLLREYYYADHMNAILGVYSDIDEVSNLQCDYLETLEKCEHLEKELSKSRTMSKSFEALQKHAINLELDLQQCKE
ncbi:hypothetical protein Tco_0432536, partial [Tanacetum coccineum]